MSAPNFMPMQYGMPLILGGNYSKLAKAYEDEYGESYNEELYEMDVYNEIKYAEELIAEIADTLTYHKITIESGRYVGFQFYVDEIYSARFDLDKESEYCIDNEDAHYYFDMCRSRVLRAADTEKRKIAKWLAGLDRRGFDRYICTAIFSNGEATYDKYTDRAAMIAAVRHVA